MTPPESLVDAAARALEKQERLARTYDAEIAPAYAAPFGEMIVAALGEEPATNVVEVGCATGGLTRDLARMLGTSAHVTAVDDAPFVSAARAKLAAELAGRVSFEVGPVVPLALPDASADLVISNLAAAASTDPARAVRELARVAARRGRVLVTVPLRGSWAEFLDIYRDVLLENGTADGVAALDAHVASLPDGPGAAAWLEEAGLVDVQVTVRRWEILFRTAREFFFAPLVELGPLSRWKRIAGRGEDMQDVFFFTKEAIDTYFHGRPFPVTIVGAVVSGRKP
jgi:ubiquinone/menaquinone biosynthesis C-methylase UbiE